MKLCEFPVLDGNSIDLALVDIRVGAKCGNTDFCVEIVACELVLCCVHDVFSSFELFTFLHGLHENIHIETYGVAKRFPM